MARRSGLGKGLDALIPTNRNNSTTTSGTSTNNGTESATGLKDIAVNAIDPNPNQPRVHFDEAALAELTASILAIGVLQPILVRPEGSDRYQLIAGERRWRAASRAGLQMIPAIVRVTDDVSSVEQALVENLHRQDLTPLEEAAAYQQLLEDFNMTHEQVASKVGKSRSAITNALRLLGLPPSIQSLLADGRLSAGHAKALLGTPDRSLQEQLAKRAVEMGWTVRGVEEAVRESQSQSTSIGGGSATGNTGKTSGKSTSPIGAKTTTLRPPGLLELEGLLAEHLQTSVGVTMSGKHGKVTIDFADLEDLERIYRLMTEGPSIED
ncbi:MAG: chromosome partitioning protein ParB [Acidimicrobiia bacterium BACL6 MAG-121220-bin61]|nr:MAG: chromosome partitioning protein ParB [Acidimicrobiia bacterium BACL6 MAG-120910-bin40]KRO65777.1 MAG: chromosome partitioning protein ParB [Acidimicrobiia bacterium BACL6 MAG-121220-bin61]